MSQPRRPCPCPRCNGALVTLRTIQYHASRVQPTSILPFSAWSRHSAGTTATQSSRSSDSDVDGMGHSPSSSQDNTEHSQPSKRFRSSTVRSSPPCSIPCHTCTISPPPMYALYLYTRTIHSQFPYPIICLSDPEQNQL
jgi:hypothetical protein